MHPISSRLYIHLYVETIIADWLIRQWVLDSPSPVLSLSADMINVGMVNQTLLPVTRFPWQPVKLQIVGIVIHYEVIRNIVFDIPTILRAMYRAVNNRRSMNLALPGKIFLLCLRNFSNTSSLITVCLCS